MANYSELYPQCAGCPRLIEWQVSRDGMTKAFETTMLNDRLHVVEKEVFEEQERVELDEKYAELVDRVEAGTIPDPVFLEAKELYEGLDEVSAAGAQKQQEADAFFDTTAHFLTGLADGEVTMMTYGCHGALEVSFLGFQKVFCRSRLPKSLSVQPPPVFPVQ